MNIYIIIVILFWHWVADFVLQTDAQATKKSSQWDALLEHTTVYSIMWLLPIIFWICYYYNDRAMLMILFAPITFVVHTVTDYYTSRVNKLLAIEAKKTEKWHGVFVSVGFDQFLHYVQLILTFKLLS